MSKNSLFIFHRDLRKEDNIGLIRTITESKKVFPVFIFTPDQVSSKNKYKSDASVQFMVNSLKELEKSLSISFFYDDTTKVIKNLLSDKKLNINHVSFNRDFTPYAKKRDEDLITLIKSKFKEVSYEVHDDVTLNPPGKCLKTDGEPYRVYTPYYKNAIKFTVEKPLGWSSSYTKKCDKIAGKSLSNVSPHNFYKEQPNCVLMGGRKEVLKILSNIKKWNDYNKIRNIPSKNTTSINKRNTSHTLLPFF